MDNAVDDEDPRFMELETLEAIFPEILRQSHISKPQLVKYESRFSFELELPVKPAQPVTVLFPAPASLTTTEFAAATQHGRDASTAFSEALVSEQIDTPSDTVDSLLISHLPPLSLTMTLPDGYPTDEPPRINISTTPQWLSTTTLRALEDDGPRLWEEAGRDMVAYTYIDHLQREAENIFGTVSATNTLEIHPQHKLAVLDFDSKAKKEAFEKETFECEICLDPKKGSKCHKMIDCGHIFCLQCLQDFYNDAIREGNLSTVRCITPNCAKERASHAKQVGHSRSKAKTAISPSELLQIGLLKDTVKRYVALKYKTELEADKDTIYCPRQWCNGAARSKKHKKPAGLEFEDLSDDDAETGQGEAHIDNGDQIANDEASKPQSKAAVKKFDPADLLSVCEDCGFPFCNRCLQTWHGEFVRCTPKRDANELTEEEKASLEYLQLHTSPCPTCNAPAQKTHGCNHMICSRCDTHFCYLCSSWLDPANPYKHYNQQGNGKVTSCFMRLWELEGGDGSDVGLGMEGGRAPRRDDNAEGLAAEDEFIELIPEVEEAEENNDDAFGAGGDAAAAAAAPRGPNDHVPVVTREAPLVLRLMGDQPREHAANAPAPPAPRGGRGGQRGGRGAAHQGRGRPAPAAYARG